MSVVVAVRKDGQTVMASDSMSVFGHHCEDHTNIASTDKILTVGSSLLGITGWGLYGNIFNHYLSSRRTAPRLSGEREIFDFFLKFWRELREKYSLVNEQANTDKEPFADLDANFLVANRKGIFHVSSNLSVCGIRRFYAIGSGCEYATGAMFALYETKQSAEAVARKAVEAAIRFDTDCGGEITVKKARS